MDRGWGGLAALSSGEREGGATSGRFRDGGSYPSRSPSFEFFHPIPMFGSLFQTLVTAVVWIVANVVYLDMKRKGLRGFTRFAAFWAGNPTTWITFFAVREGAQPTFEAPELEDELLDAIRRDRALRGRVERPDPPKGGSSRTV